MQEPSIRSFTLDYYRSQGAELKPLDPAAKRWEVQLPRARRAEAALHISFDPQPDEEDLQPMARTTAQWQEILESCLQARPVSYRHLVIEPVAQIAEHFRHKLPQFQIKAVHLQQVKLRQAIGFTHRVTYDAPAMAARHDELHHDLLDAETGERLHDLSDRFYSLPTIPIPPPLDISSLNLEDLHARVLEIVDDRSESRGLTNDLELAGRLAEAEDRIHQAFLEQIAKLFLHEEQELTQRFEALARRSQETRLPGAQAKLREEADAILREIDALHARREAASAQILADERARLETERARHETTVETTLVSIAYVTYDAVCYQLEISLGEALGLLDVSYVPVTDELALSPCPRCLQPFARGSNAPEHGIAQSRVVCHRCTPTIDAGATSRPSHESCTRCGIESPSEAVQRCHLSGIAYCVVCAMSCQECGQITHRDLLRPNPGGRGMICPDHFFACSSCNQQATARNTFKCPGCQTRHCHSHAHFCSDCGMPACHGCEPVKGKGCAACNSLAPVKPSHDRICLLLGLMPHLQRFGTRWQLAEAGDLCLIEWQLPLGQRGRLVLSVPDLSLLSQREKGPFERHWH